MKYREFLKPSLSNTLVSKIIDMDGAYVKFFKGRGFPRYKKKGDDSLIYNKSRIRIEGNRIKFMKLGSVKFRGRLLEGEVRNITIKRTIFGLYTASILYKVEPQERATGGILGIDVNCLKSGEYSVWVWREVSEVEGDEVTLLDPSRHYDMEGNKKGTKRTYHKDELVKV